MPYKKHITIIGLGVSLLLAACQPLERPFQPDQKTSVRGAPGPRAALFIAPVENGPVDLDARLAKQLQELGIVAFSGEKIPYRYSVESQVDIKDGASIVTWTILEPSGRKTTLVASEKIGDLIEGPGLIGPDLDKVALKSASKIDILLGGSGVNFASLEKPALFVPIVVGAPGDGAETLAAAMQENFIEYGMDVTADQWQANYVVKGIVNLTPPKRGSQVISILWKLERRNGEYVGKVEQKNRIKAGSLNGPWGPVAKAAAKGGSRGILNLLREAEPAYFNKK